MNIDLTPVYAGKIAYSDILRDLHHVDLYRLTDDLFVSLESQLASATDAAVLFIPHDPAASDPVEQGWTLGHVVAHLTATLEEAATVAVLLARGVSVEQRLRFETPWEQLSSLQLVLARLQECRRICRALLDAWPDEPHLDITMTLIPLIGPMIAIGFYVLGISHGQEHLPQLDEVLHQYSLSQHL